MHALARKAAMPVMDDVILPDREACRWYREHYGKGVFFPIVRDERAFREQCREALSMSHSMQREYGLHGKRVVLYVGRLAPEKNLECLVRAAAALPEDAVLVIAGSGSLGPELQDLAVRLKVSAIFTGWLEGERLAAWYNLADVFVLPSLVEPFGAVVNDALAAGCFCLVSGRCGSACLIRRGWTGELFDPEDRKGAGLSSPENLPGPRRQGICRSPAAPGKKCLQNACGIPGIRSPISWNILYDEMLPPDAAPGRSRPILFSAFPG